MFTSETDDVWGHPLLGMSLLFQVEKGDKVGPVDLRARTRML